MGDLRTIPDILSEAAATPHGVTFVDRGLETTRSYREILDASRRAAASLTAAGLHRGDLVALVLRDPEAFLTSLFGASIAGIVPALVYPPMTTVDLPAYFDGVQRAKQHADEPHVVVQRQPAHRYVMLLGAESVRAVDRSHIRRDVAMRQRDAFRRRRRP